MTRLIWIKAPAGGKGHVEGGWVGLPLTQLDWGAVSLSSGRRAPLLETSSSLAGCLPRPCRGRGGRATRSNDWYTTVVAISLDPSQQVPMTMPQSGMNPPPCVGLSLLN